MRLPEGRLVVGGVILGFLISLGGMAASAQEAKPIVRVIFAQGTVEVQRHGTSAWIVAQRGMPLAAQDTIRTGAQSLAELAFDAHQHNVIRLEQAGQITIERLLPTRLRLPQGDLFSFIKQLPAGSRFEVRTPTAVVGVRGTGWSVTTDGRRTRASVFTGTIIGQGLTPQGELTRAAAIDEGFKTFFDERGQMSALEQLTEEELAYWKNVELEMLQHFKDFQAITEKIFSEGEQMLEDISQEWKELEKEEPQ